MICILALIVFAILAVFSARYRPLAKEAFDCVFRRVTFRKCTSRLDQRLKAQLSGKAMAKNKAVGRFLYKNFEVISWTFLILLTLSTVQTGISVYNLAVYGNCNGPDENGFCILDPLGTHNAQISTEELCTAPNATATQLNAPALSSLTRHPQTGSAQASVTVIEFGCFACPNTAKQASEVKKLIEHYGSQIHFIYIDFPLPTHEYAWESSLAAACVLEQDELLYWKYHFTLLERQDQLNTENLHAWAQEVGTDVALYDVCLESGQTKPLVEQDINIGEASGVYGTPTIFINDEPLVGVKKYALLKVRIDDLLE